MLTRAVSSEDLTEAEESVCSVAHSHGSWQEATASHWLLAGNLSSSLCGLLHWIVYVFS